MGLFSRLFYLPSCALSGDAEKTSLGAAEALVVRAISISRVVAVQLLTELEMVGHVVGFDGTGRPKRVTSRMT